MYGARVAHVAAHCIEEQLVAKDVRSMRAWSSPMPIGRRESKATSDFHRTATYEYLAVLDSAVFGASLGAKRTFDRTCTSQKGHYRK